MKCLLTGAFCVLLAGCSGRPSKAAKEPEKPIIKEKMAVETPEGEATALDDTPARNPLYHVTWQSARLNVSDQGVFAGSMDNVKGEMYKGGKIANSFTADHAIAERESSTLTLLDHVSVTSKSEGATLACDKAEWQKDKIVKAFGHVTIRGTFRSVTGLNEVWATPDLKVIASPAMFKP